MDEMNEQDNTRDRKVARISPEELRNKAIANHKAGDLSKAVNGYKLCLKINPQDAGIWCNLGAALRKQKHYQSAVNCYRRALELTPGDLAVIGNLANALKDLHRLDEALDLHSQLVTVDPANVQSLMNYAAALREAGEFEQALRQLDKAKSLDMDHAGVEWERAQNLLYLSRYTEGWQAFEARWHTGELPTRYYPFPQWRGESLQGKHLLLHTEQGYGDTILAARYIALLKRQGAQITVQLKPELHRLFAAVGADHLVVPDNDGHASTPPEGLAFDYHCPMMSLMAGFDAQPNTIPPPARLNIPESSQEKFKFLQQQYPACLKVGIVWSGSITFANNENRAVSLRHFLPFAEIEGVRLYSLQKGPKEKELMAHGADCIIENLGARCEDFADTAAAIANLDIIVMTDSSVAHLAASMGKPVINLLQKVPYWLYTLKETTTPWYPSMQLIKQQEVGIWDDVFKQAAEVLRTKSLEIKLSAKLAADQSMATKYS